jgi:hypothetical protein
MALLVVFHWGWLVESLLLGLAVGWIAVVHRGQGVAAITSLWLAALVVVLAVLALTRIVPGRAGYWLDLGLIMFVLYAVGCIAGSWLRHWVLLRSAPPA